MADIAIWQDKDARAAFIDKGREAFAGIREELQDQEGAVVVAIEPESRDYFVGETLGGANQAAFETYPDQWMYFVRVDDPEAEIPLPTW